MNKVEMTRGEERSGGENAAEKEDSRGRGPNAIKTGRRTLVRVTTTTTTNYAERRKRMRKGEVEGEDGRSVITCTIAETSPKLPLVYVADPRYILI